MTQTFVFTAGNPEARQHLVDSIGSPVDDETVFGSIASADREELERIRVEGNGFYAWGAVPGLRNIPTWETMERDDYVLCVYGPCTIIRSCTFIRVSAKKWPEGCSRMALSADVTATVQC
jgi:hypothetical protein